MKQRPSLPIVEIAVAVVAFGALAITWWLSARQMEAQQGRFDTMSAYDASSGGYRAWYELLSREGVRVERFELRPAFLDQSIDVYISAGDMLNEMAAQAYGKSFEPMTDGDWDALAKWVKAGGHFVWLTDGTPADQPRYMNVPLVDKLGPAADGAVTVAPSPITQGVRSVSGTSKLRVPFGGSGSAAPLVADDTGGVVMSYPLGKGTVTIVADESLFQNTRLAQADNARLAFDLATAGLTPHGSVAFDEWSHGFVAGDSWWAILPRPFQAALIVIAFALVLLTVGTALRFGPTARLPDESERTSAEYLTSMALLLQRGRAVRSAIGDMADACIRDVAAALGLADSASPRTIAARAGSAQDDERADAVMELDRLRSFEYPHEADLMKTAKLCAYLRKEFSRHGSIGIGRRASSSRRIA
jgi:hypothetical protein